MPDHLNRIEAKLNSIIEQVNALNESFTTGTENIYLRLIKIEELMWKIERRKSINLLSTNELRDRVVRRGTLTNKKPVKFSEMSEKDRLETMLAMRDED